MKASFRIDMTPLNRALQRIQGNVGDGLGKAVLGGLFTLEAYAKLNIRSTFNQRTGNLASNWETVLDKVSDKNAEGHTSPLSVYARIQELGGVIRATRAGALRFQIDGKWITTKAVTLPARPYLRPAADAHQNDIIQTVSNILTDLILGN